MNSELFWILKIFSCHLVTQGYLPRSILMPLSSDDELDLCSPAPPIPIRHDIPVPSRVPLPLPRTKLRSNFHQPLNNTLSRANTESEPCLINSAHHLEEENERIYLNQVDCRSATVETNEYHQYASIDLDDSNADESNNQEHVRIVNDFLPENFFSLI